MNNSSSLKCRIEGGGTPVLQSWGADCEYGLLRDVLLGPPDHYRWLETSSVSKKSIRRKFPFDPGVAKQQHAEMVSAFESAGVTAHFLEADPKLPYQIFARDSSAMTPYGAIITNMANWWRRGENFRAIETYHRLGIPIYDYVTAGTFEGGDFNVIEPGTVLIGWEGHEGRSQEEAALQLKDWFEAEDWEVMLADIDPFYVHIDLMVVMLTHKLAAVCLESTDPQVVRWLKSKHIELVPVPFQDTLDLGCNVMSLGGDRILLPERSHVLKQRARAHGLEIYDPDMSMITPGGGGVHCMCQALRRDPVG
ncbi:MAG: amidinotransferase [Gammaproteobacteria bacterium]|nr:amidinotransferase [Gammaproteobacteria bacterium]MYD77269.1 amidinotransferase [Gammaproteobacteria bacterium]MYJ52057.1 amidinotransferase [Gammaproteobacteria bacterium]